MKKAALAVALAAALAAAVLAGCETVPKSRYGDVNDDVYGNKAKMEYTQQVQAVEEIVGKLLTDPDFEDIYADAKARAEARGHKRPTVMVVWPIQPLPGHSDYETSQMRTELMTALRKTRLFRVVDLQEREMMKQMVIAEADSGARGDNTQHIGDYEASDFVMRGKIVREHIDGSWFHCFNLLMVDTASGNPAWSDTVKIRKD